MGDLKTKREIGGSGSALGSNPDISQEYKMIDISKGVADIF
jgi:hypothetical protein